MRNYVQYRFILFVFTILLLVMMSVLTPAAAQSDEVGFISGDVYATLEGPKDLPPEERGQGTILGVISNIVMDSVQVTCPDSTQLIIPNYTDSFTPGVDQVSLFRFNTVKSGMPMAGGTYTFTALDDFGNPIPGVEATDVWVGVQAPDPPTNVHAIMTGEGIWVTWDDVPVISGSFEPASGLGFYQMELSEPSGQVYGVTSLATPGYLIPKDKADFGPHDYGLSLDELPDGTYHIRTCVHSVAPQGSAGHGFEYNNADSSQTIFFNIENGVITPGINFSLEPAATTSTCPGTGVASFTASAGAIENLTSVCEGTLPTAGKPNLVFTHGLFSFNITGLTPGQTVTVTITLQSPVSVGTQYWKYGPTSANPGGEWYQIPMGDDDGDNVITIQLQDGGVGDDYYLAADGMIVDQGGPGYPPPAPARSVGGIAVEFPVGGSDSSSPPYAVIIGGIMAALAALVLVGWFARRRWLGRCS